MNPNDTEVLDLVSAVGDQIESRQIRGTLRFGTPSFRKEMK